MLTNIQLRNLKPGGKKLMDGSIPGLMVEPTANSGVGKWTLRFQSPITRKRRDMGLGRYPDVSLSEARELALDARKIIDAGLDPIEQRKQKRTAFEEGVLTVPTFEDAALQVYADLLPGWTNAKHGAQWMTTMEQYVFPLIGGRPVDQLKPKDFADVLKPIWLTKRETATRIKQRCHGVMKWSWGRKYVPSNPVDMVDTLLPKPGVSHKLVQHFPAMPWALVPGFIQDHVHKNDSVTADLLEFVILTACRSGEARKMTWNEIDWETATWTIPAAHMGKTGRTHRVPLSTRAVEILTKRKRQRCKSDLVFPSPSGKVLTDMALTKYLRDKAAPSDKPDRFATAHGFRSSFRDWASENGYARDLAERALAHTIKDGGEAAYHRTDLLAQRRPMMEAWAQHVLGQQHNALATG